jgi:hypothetical protein
VFDPAIKAMATITLALPKAGLRAPGVEALVGGTLPGRHQRTPLPLRRARPGSPGGVAICLERDSPAALSTDGVAAVGLEAGDGALSP